MSEDQRAPSSAPGPRPGRGAAKGRLVVVGVVTVVVLATVFVVSGGVHRGRPQGPATAAASRSVGDAVPQFEASPTAAQATLLDEAVGFGSGVTGGAGGTEVVVSTGADSGPGSLREAVAGDSPKWVTFDRDLTVTLSSRISVGSNTTIDGRGHRVVLTAAGKETSGLVVSHVHNVILESLTMHSFGPSRRAQPAAQPVALKSHSREVLVDDAVGVWIDHLDLSHGADKVIAVPQARGVTLSWNHVHDQREVFQIGSVDLPKGSAATTVTMHHNYFDGVYFKMPNLNYGWVHAYDNYYRDWGEVAVRSTRRGQLVLEHNVFDGVRSKVPGRVVTRTIVAGSGCTAEVTQCNDDDGYLRATANRVRGEEPAEGHEAARVFDPARYYRYDAEKADDALVAAVRAGAGPVTA